MIDVFPSGQQRRIRLQLSNVLEGIVSQHLLPCANGGRVPACEVMIVNDAIRSLIREKKNPNAILDQIQMNHKRMVLRLYLRAWQICKLGFDNK